MSATKRLGLYAAVLVTVFGLSYVLIGALVPQRVVQEWAVAAQDEHGSGSRSDHSVAGLSASADGYRLTEVSAPADVDRAGLLELTVVGPDGQSLSDFTVSHAQELHLIVVRTDGEHFRHVHPERDDDGRWSIDWQWEEPGSYRIFADFVPAGRDGDVTLSTIVGVPGPAELRTDLSPATTADVDGMRAELTGQLRAGQAETLRFSITGDDGGEITPEPYLDAAGHLVALRAGDLAYAHVHPHDEELAFDLEVPTPGEYLLYLDVQIEGGVHTFPFVIEVTDGDH